MTTIPVFVTLGSSQLVGLRIAADAFVGDLIKMVITELKMSATPNYVILRFASSGAGETGAALDPRQTLLEAKVGKKSELIIEVLDDGAFIEGSSWSHCRR